MAAVYAINFAFYCRLFHVRKTNKVVALNFTYKRKGGFLGKIYDRYMRFALCSDYIDYFHVPSGNYAESCSKDLNMVSIPESIVSGTPILTNLQPASAGYIAKEHLGIAKDSWCVDELKQMIDNDSLFVDNCIKYRDKLTSKQSSKMLVDIFEERNKNR